MLLTLNSLFAFFLSYLHVYIHYSDMQDTQSSEALLTDCSTISNSKILSTTYKLHYILPTIVKYHYCHKILGTQAI